MFKSKRDVDRHVTQVLTRIKDAKERNSRGFRFAKLYYDVSDYESAKRYLQEFLNVREVVPQAHKLMGQIYEALHDRNKALDSYRRSLDLDPDQKELVLKVCELYCDPRVQVNPAAAKVWIERAEEFFPGHYTVFNLKERVIDSEGDTGDLETLINTELSKYPEDDKLHARLLKLYIKSRQIDRAYDHAIKTEKKLPFVSSMGWYECLADVYQVYQDEHGCEEDTVFYTQKLFTICNLTTLRLQTEDRDMLSAIKSLNQFDQDLNTAQAIQKKGSEWESFLAEMKGQYFFQVAVLVLKRALKGQLSWTNTCSPSAFCFLLSDSFLPINQKTSWYCQLPPDRRKFYEHLHTQGCDRLSQGGHMILAFLSKQDGCQWVGTLRERFSPAQGRESLHSLIFTDRDMRRKKDSSFLLSSDTFTKASLNVPLKTQLLKYDSVAYRLHSDNLNHLVWIALRYHSCNKEVQKDYEQTFGNQLFPSMKFGMMDLSSGDPATLCQLDVQREAKRNLHPIPDKPGLLPVCLSNNLCTEQQTDWWNAMYRLETNTASEKLAKLMMVLTRGLETLRLVMPHTMPLYLLVHVARTLDKRTEEMESRDSEGVVCRKLAAVQDRAAFYWKSAEQIIDRIDRNSGIKMPKDMLFPANVNVNDPAQLKVLREQIKFALACVAMREERYEQAIEDFGNLPQAKAAYCTGVVYRRLYESLDVNTNAGGEAPNSQQMALLSKSKGALHKALDRLEAENNEELKEVVSEELDGIMVKMISLESGEILGNSVMSNNSLYYDTAESEPSKSPPQSTPTGKYQSQVVLHPSPTKVEYQFRELDTNVKALTSRLTNLEEYFRTNQKLIQDMIQQQRELKDENRTLREQIQVLSLQGLSNMHRQSIGQSFPGTPQQRSMLNMMNNSFGAVPPTHDYQVPTAIPAHLSHYAYPAAAVSPRPGSAYGGQPNFEDELNHIDGEYYDPETEGDCFPQDQNLIQEWPFGHKTGVEGKSTITYSPQHVGKGVGQANPGVFVSALRGQSIQYGAYQQPAMPSQAAPQMPGPGFFSQTNQPVVSPSVQTQPPIYPAQSQLGVVMNVAGTTPALSPSYPPKGTPGVTLVRPATTTMMPPNAVMSSTVEAKPKLIPGSVGVPPPKTQSGPMPQPVLSTPSSVGTGLAGNQMAKPSQYTQGPGLFGLAGQASPASVVTPTASILGQNTPGSAASMLSQLAAKQQQQSVPSVNVPVSTPQKTVFKGFSFSSTPKITETKPEGTEKDNKATTSSASEAPKPFSGFSFTPAKTSAPATPTLGVTKPVVSVGQATSTQAASTPQAGAGFAFGSSSSTPTFGGIASQGSTDSAFKGMQGDGFKGSGLPVFGKSPSPRRRDPSCGSDDHVEEYEPSVDFKPVVPLPDLIQVKTGEEDEEKVFGDRAKLFRFDVETTQWKERGIGELKILKHQQKTQFRILMRREQVLKLCANHLLNVDMKLAPLMSSEKTLAWTAADYAEEDMKFEKFAARFKNGDKANDFKSAFEKCQEELKGVKDKKPVGGATPDVNKKRAESTKGKETIAQMFKPKPGEWICDGCTVKNGPDLVKCPCCGTGNPRVTPEQLKAAANKQPQSAQGGFTFGSVSSSQDSAGAFKLGAQPSSTPAKSGFSFGSLGGSTPTVAAPDSTTAGTTQGQPAQSGTAASGSGFTFGSLSKPQTTSAESKPGFGFASTTTSTPPAAGSLFGSQPSAPAASTGSTGLLFGKPAETTSAGFNINKEETKYPFESSTASKEDIAGSGNSLLAKYLTCPESWSCYKCQSKHEGVTDVCPNCKITRDESAAKEREIRTLKPGFGFASSESGKAFSFGKPDSAMLPSKSSEGFNFAFTPSSEGQKSQPPAAIGSGFNFSLSITRSLTDTTPTKSMSQPSTSVTSPKSPEVTDDGYYVNKEGDDSHIYFEPVVPLPAKVEVKLGEEDEEVIFTHRSKLYRFTAGEWKERGLGNIKILYHPESKKARLVMRRDAILKLCCNHYITPEIHFKPMPNSNNCALIWFAMDFSGDEPKAEQFAIKFKNAEIVSTFEKAVQEAKDRMAGKVTKQLTNVETVRAKTAPSPATETKSTAQSRDGDCVFVKEVRASDEQIMMARKFKLPDHFYLYEELPNCPGCRGCDNENWSYEKEIEQYGGEEDQDEDEEDNEDYDTDEYEDYDDEDDDEEEEDEENGAKNKKETKMSEAASKGSEEESAGFVFGNTGGGFSFASLAKTSQNQPFGLANTDKPFHWEGAGKQLFGAGGGARAEGGGDNGDGDDDYVQQGEEPHFEPIVPLPELVEVKTGEEDESRVYCQRAKIFRFDKSTSQWKEKGIGDMKILKHKETGKHRLLMRREQVHKLACNHLLTADILFMPMNTSETSWCWTTQDYSEPEGRLEQLAIKFKTIELANAFKTKIDEIQGESPS